MTGLTVSGTLTESVDCPLRAVCCFGQGQAELQTVLPCRTAQDSTWMASTSGYPIHSVEEVRLIQHVWNRLQLGVLFQHGFLGSYSSGLVFLRIRSNPSANRPEPVRAERWRCTWDIVWILCLPADAEFDARKTSHPRWCDVTVLWTFREQFLRSGKCERMVPAA